MELQSQRYLAKMLEGKNIGERAAIGKQLEAYAKLVLNEVKEEAMEMMPDTSEMLVSGTLFRKAKGGETVNVDSAKVKEYFPVAEYPEIYVKRARKPAITISFPVDNPQSRAA